MHLFDATRRFYGGNAIVAGGLPVAVGLALADHMNARPNVTACIFGDGAMAEGEFHESANLAALWKLPVLFCCENNRYAMGTALAREHAQTDLATRAASYGMIAWAVDGMDVEAVAEATRRAVDEIRGGGGPCFLELRTYRFRAHSMYDPDRYREKSEIEQWKQSDPIPALAGQRWRPDMTKPTAAATAAAPATGAATEGLQTTYREALREAHRDALTRDPRVFLMGEDVGRYGGCFAVSLGLLEEFGPERIRDAPLSESGFTGAGIGAALGGMRPIVEIMTVNFSLLAMDQILNNAATLLHMSGGSCRFRWWCG